jgi:hypothetical protein
MTKGRAARTSAAVTEGLDGPAIALQQAPDLQFFQPLANSSWKRYPPPCHPERSRGTCSSLHPQSMLLQLAPSTSAEAMFFDGS